MIQMSMIHIYIYIYIYIFGVLLYCYCLYLVSINLLAKNRIFFSLFSRDSTLGAYRGVTLLSYISNK